MELNSKYNDLYLHKLHQDILTIMDEVDRVCKANHLRYYLMAGSCLGAVRHHGFIPWDDDMDIAMPRADFDRFISLASQISDDGIKTLDNRFYLRWVTTDKYYNHAFAKVCLKGTVFQESNGPSARNAGIYIDVFPLDSCDSYSRKIERQNRMFISLGQLLRYKGAGPKFDWKLKDLVKKVLTTLFSVNTIHKVMLRVINPTDENKTDYQVFYGTPYPIQRMIFPKEWHGEGRRMAFEDRYYVCPSEADLCLMRIYGDNYMQIPPENKRKSHYPLRVVFSDGEEMLFEKTKERVKYKDLLD